MSLQPVLQDLLDALCDKAVVLDRSGRIVATNSSWRDFCVANDGDPHQSGPGVNYLSCCDPSELSDADRNVIRGIRAVLDGASAFQADYPCHSPTEKRWFRLIARPIPRSDGHTLVLHRDVTSSVLAIEQLEDDVDIREHLAALVETSSDAICSIDLFGRVTAWNPAAEVMYGHKSKDIVGRSIEMIYPPGWATDAQSYIDDIVAGRLRSFRATRRHKNGNDIEVHIAVAPLVRGGRIVGVSSVHRIASDVASTIMAGTIEQELSHRLRNILTVVTALARQTARQALNLDDFQVQFAGRLNGLAVSNDLLTGSDTRVVTLEQVVRAHLRAFTVCDEARVHVAGPEYILRRDSVQAMGLAFHELGTNSLKYGALAIPNGRLQVSWRREERKGVPGLLITWHETALQNVRMPKRKGFGYQALTMLTPRAVRGDKAYEFQNEEVMWTLWKPEQSANGLG